MAIDGDHADYLLSQKVNRCELLAVCSTSPQKLEFYKARKLELFGSGESLIRSGGLDAVLIATPHYQHTSLGIAALEAGLHVTVEKPISAHKADAERLIAVAARRPYLINANISADKNPGCAGVWELPGLGQSQPAFGGRYQP